MSTEPEPIGKVIRLDVGGTDGRLTTRVGTHIPVRVFERGADLLLVLMIEAAEELAQDPAQPLVLEYVSARGLVLHHGVAVPQERDLVRFELTAEPEVTQRREFVRVPTLQAVVLDGDGVTSKIRTQAIDLSGGGMLLGAAGALELGAIVHFTLDLGPDYAVARWFILSAGYVLSKRTSDYAQSVSLNYTRNEVYLRLTFTY